MKDSKKKLCILISGPLRTFEKVWPVNLKILENLKLDFQCFLHTWDENIPTYKNTTDGYKGWIWQWQNMAYEPQHNYNIESILKSHNILQYEVENFTSYLNENKFLEKFSDKSFYLRLLNSTAMYYGMNKCLQIAKNSNIDFSHALRLRPDFQLPSSFELSDSSKILFHGPGVSIKGKVVSDQCFSGNFKQMNNIMSAYSRLVENFDTQKFNHEKIEFEIAENVIFSQLEKFGYLEQSQILTRPQLGKVIRPEVMKKRGKYKFKFYLNGMKFWKFVWTKRLHKVILSLKYGVGRKD